MFLASPRFSMMDWSFCSTVSRLDEVESKYCKRLKSSIVLEDRYIGSKLRIRVRMQLGLS